MTQNNKINFKLGFKVIGGIEYDTLQILFLFSWTNLKISLQGYPKVIAKRSNGVNTDKIA